MASALVHANPDSAMHGVIVLSLRIVCFNMPASWYLSAMVLTVHWHVPSTDSMSLLVRKPARSWDS